MGLKTIAVAAIAIMTASFSNATAGGEWYPNPNGERLLERLISDDFRAFLQHGAQHSLFSYSDGTDPIPAIRKWLHGQGPLPPPLDSPGALLLVPTYMIGGNPDVERACSGEVKSLECQHAMSSAELSLELNDIKIEYRRAASQLSLPKIDDESFSRYWDRLRAGLAKRAKSQAGDTPSISSAQSGRSIPIYPVDKYCRDWGHDLRAMNYCVEQSQNDYEEVKSTWERVPLETRRACLSVYAGTETTARPYGGIAECLSQYVQAHRYDGGRHFQP